MKVTSREAKKLKKLEWRRANREKERAASRRRRYGITEREVAELLRAQGGVCRICRASNPDAIDHCHRTGRVRGILCRACNAGLGLFKENLDVMRTAAAYLVQVKPE